MGVYPITKTYGAKHGYSVNVFPVQSLVELRASYFSCHTYNKVATLLFTGIIQPEELVGLSCFMHYFRKTKCSASTST